MKVYSTTPTPLLDALAGPSRGTRGREPGRAGDHVRLSGAGRFVRELQDEVGRLPEVSVEEVARARADIAAGRLGSDEDLAAAVEGLLAGI